MLRFDTTDRCHKMPLEKPASGRIRSGRVVISDLSKRPKRTPSFGVQKPEDEDAVGSTGLFSNSKRPKQEPGHFPFGSEEDDLFRDGGGFQPLPPRRFEDLHRHLESARVSNEMLGTGRAPAAPRSSQFNTAVDAPPPQPTAFLPYIAATLFFAFAAAGAIFYFQAPKAAADFKVAAPDGVNLKDESRIAGTAESSLAQATAKRSEPEPRPEAPVEAPSLSVGSTDTAPKLAAAPSMPEKAKPAPAPSVAPRFETSVKVELPAKAATSAKSEGLAKFETSAKSGSPAKSGAPVKSEASDKPEAWADTLATFKQAVSEKKNSEDAERQKVIDALQDRLNARTRR